MPTSPAAQPPPGREALARRQPAVQHGDVVAEAGAKARDELRRQRDLGHQHQRAAPGRARRCDDAQVDLGLARAGDPLQAGSCRSRPPAPTTSVSTACACAGVSVIPAARRRRALPARARIIAVLDARQTDRDQRAQRRALGDRQRRHQQAFTRGTRGARRRARGGQLVRRARASRRPAWATHRAAAPVARAYATVGGGRRLCTSSPTSIRPGVDQARRSRCAARRTARTSRRQRQLAARRRQRDQHRIRPGRARESAPAGAPAPACPARSDARRASRSPARPAAAPRAAPRRAAPGSSPPPSGRSRSSPRRTPARRRRSLRCPSSPLSLAGAPARATTNPVTVRVPNGTTTCAPIGARAPGRGSRYVNVPCTGSATAISRKEPASSTISSLLRGGLGQQAREARAHVVGDVAALQARSTAIATT